MAYNENSVQRIREILQQKNADFYEKKMFGGICFMVDDKICCATRTDKNSGEDLLLCRINEQEFHKAILEEYAIAMGSPAKPMVGFLFVTETAWASVKDLNYWVQLCLDFNPFAKSTTKKK